MARNQIINGGVGGIPPLPAVVQQFSHFADAAEHQAKHGGWLFVADGASGAVWYDGACFTPSAVMLHPWSHGSGRII